MHMTALRIVGIVLLVAGVILFILGVSASDSLVNQFTNFFTGHFTETTVWYMVGGAAMAVGGLALAVSGRHRAWG
jgi:uncharacterized membrane protein YiaA